MIQENKTISSLLAQFIKEKAALTSEIESLTNENDRLKSELARTKALNDWFTGQLRLSKVRAFGTSSEASETLSLVFDEAELSQDPSLPEPTIEEVVEKKKPHHPKKKGHREAQLKDLEIKEVTHEIPEAERVCPCCAKPMNFIGTEKRHTIEYVPAQFIHQIDLQEKYACKNCQDNDVKTPIIAAKIPKTPIIKSVASASLLAFIIYRKYVEAMPLYRQEVSLERDDLNISRQTMSNWMIKCSEILTPLYERLHDYLIAGDIVRADETVIQVLNEKGRKAQSQSYMWHYGRHLDGISISMFDYQQTRAGENPKNFLKNFTGYIQADGYAAYNCVPKVIISACWAHARRKFHEAIFALPDAARKLGKSNAHVGFDFCNQLYAIEHEAKGKSDAEILNLRQTKSAAILAKLRTWLDERHSETAPKSQFGMAVNYCINQWDKLIQYINDPRLEIDNNRAERSIKPFVIGRKNWIFANTPSGAKASAILYSIAETAIENKLHPRKYLEYLLNEIPKRANGAPIDDLLPWSTEVRQIFLDNSS
ncbi:MAG: IS66 family transposase [Candidatus Pacebacteria bacterium]|nr:IS66 family transposase [Candidatus Paceibacterota bacterium]